MKPVRRWSLLLCLTVLVTLACGMPSLPVLTRAEPTATPRATRTSRPTFTPTATDTAIPPTPPTATATNTAAPTDTPVVPPTEVPPPTNTPGPRPPTNTPRPPTNTPPPAPPTNTPQPTSPPAPQFQFTAAVGDTSASNNCALTSIVGQIVNRSGNPIGGFKFHVSADGWNGVDSNASRNAFDNAGAPTQHNADVVLANTYPPKAGKWYVVLIDDNGSPLSNSLAVTTDPDTDAKPCGVKTAKGGGIQVVPVVFTRN
jgi:hypothetical protein